jgi:hypothetical protein
VCKRNFRFEGLDSAGCRLAGTDDPTIWKRASFDNGCSAFFLGCFGDHADAAALLPQFWGPGFASCCPCRALGFCTGCVEDVDRMQ